MKRRRARLETGRGRNTARAAPEPARKTAEKPAKPGTVRVISYTPGGETWESRPDPLAGTPTGRL